MPRVKKNTQINYLSDDHVYQSELFNMLNTTFPNVISQIITLLLNEVFERMYRCPMYELREYNVWMCEMRRSTTPTLMRGVSDNIDEMVQYKRDYARGIYNIPVMCMEGIDNSRCDSLVNIRKRRVEHIRGFVAILLRERLNMRIVTTNTSG